MIRRLFILAALAAVGLAGTGFVATAAPTPSCAIVRVHDTAGQLCDTGGDTLQILVHGVTYSKSYWDAPNGMSYQQQAAAAGMSTLAVDRLGHGDSAERSPLTNLARGQAAELHHVITWAHHRYTHVVTVGHSYGSLVAQLEAALFHDVNGLILTGFSHHIPAKVLTTIALAARPSIAEPGAVGLAQSLRDTKFRPQQQIRTWDTTQAETLDAAELAALPEGAQTPLASSRVRAPVLMLNASHDALLCADSWCADQTTLDHNERALYPHAASFTPRVVTSHSHCLALAAVHTEATRIAVSWTKETI